MAERRRIALSPTAAAELLPFAVNEARQWLRRRGLVRTFTDAGTGRVRELVIVSDVEAVLRMDAPAPIDVELGVAQGEQLAPAPKRPRRTGPYIDPRD